MSTRGKEAADSPARRRQGLGLVLELRNALYLLSVHFGECLDALQNSASARTPGRAARTRT
ncbi:MAG: hypothetical protein JXR37_37865 [Kiritimatiellae bacterium]|nr:hypothetical protein [Kiritimatiellia bacterium]